MNSFRRCMAPAVVALGLLGTPLASVPAVTIDWVTVGDPGNAADTSTYGAVRNVYRIPSSTIRRARSVTSASAWRVRPPSSIPPA